MSCHCMGTGLITCSDAGLEKSTELQRLGRTSLPESMNLLLLSDINCKMKIDRGLREDAEYGVRGQSSFVIDGDKDTRKKNLAQRSSRHAWVECTV